MSQLRKKIIELLPEIKALKAGCELDLNCGESYGCMTIHRTVSVCKKHKKYREECGAEEGGCSLSDAVYGTSGTGDDEEWWEHTVKIADIKPHQIIGRPITLADVLRVMGRGWSIDARGVFWHVEHLQNGGMDMKGHTLEGGVWDFSTDLDGQKRECKAFLSKLLVEGVEL